MSVATTPGPSTTAPGTGSADQTFLVGETLYLRGLEEADAKRATTWRQEPFPITSERAEEILKKEIASQGWQGKRWLLAVRRADDRPVGTVTWSTWDWSTADFRIVVDPVQAPDAAAAIEAELIGLMVPYLLYEREFKSVHFDWPEGAPEPLAAAQAAGLIERGRLREARWLRGARRDLLLMEALHPAWVQRLGDPALGDDAFKDQIAAQRAEFAARPPSRRRVGSVPLDTIGDAERPANAFGIGERVYIRPLEIEDADEIARWSRRETETFFDSRGIASPLNLAEHIRNLGKSDPPEWIRFAIVLRDGDVLIGANGLSDIDWIDRTGETESFIHRPEYRGGGYGTEAKHLLLEHVFDRLGFHGVRSYVWQPNGRSAAALRKQGYRDAAIMHWDGYQKAEPVNFLAFDYLATEWRALRDAANEA